MSARNQLALLMLGVFAAGLALAQTGNPPPSRIDQLNRQRDALERRTEALARLELSYTSSGQLTSALKKNSPQSLVIRVMVNKNRVKDIAKSEKRTVATGVEPGELKVEARWTRPGARLVTRCAAELEIGFQEVLILPFGGQENFSCQVLPRALPLPVIEAWEKALEPEEAVAVTACVASEEPGNAGFWPCVDRQRIELPWD